MIRHYYYNQQLKKFILGFSNVFAGMQVYGGLDGAGAPIQMEVPVRYGSTDRVTAALAAGNTQNKLHTIPMMSCYMTGLELAPDRLHGVNQTDRRTYLEQGGIFPTDVKSIKRVMAIPYNMQMELAIYASNTDQMFQIIEQILMLFDYDLQLQFNDAAFDWTKISKLYLRSITNEENYPMGSERRAIIWTLQFELPIWMSPPMEIRNDLIQNITIRLGDLDSMTLDEIDANGNLVPFSTTFATIHITNPLNTIVGLQLLNGGSLYADGIYNDVHLIGGTGKGATADIKISAGIAMSIIARNSGVGYTVGDVLSASANSIGGLRTIDVPANNLVIGTAYTIKSVGTTDYTLVGAANNSIGTQFTATLIVNVSPVSGFNIGAGTGIATTNVIGSGLGISVISVSPVTPADPGRTQAANPGGIKV